VGAGAMGRGIAQVCAAAGCSVQLYDARADAAASAIELVRAELMSMVKRGKSSQADANATLQRMMASRALEEMSDCDIVVEAIVEQLDAKQALLCALEAIVQPACLLVTNTSSLSVTAIAAACSRPQRVAGWHFFNPVPRMKLVEVVQAPLTNATTVRALVALSARIGHRAIIVPDSPGFLVNHAGRAFVTEGLKLLAERTADHVVLDSILRNCAGFRMGPFELLDLTGLDVSVPVMESIHSQFYGDDRFRPVQLAKTRLCAGLLGRKSGRGFYEYDAEGQKQGGTLAAAVTGAAPAGTPATIQNDAPEIAFWWPTEGDGALPASSVALLHGCRRVEHAAEAAVIIVAPLGADLSTTVATLQVPPASTVAMDSVFASRTGVTLMVCPATAPQTVDAARTVFERESVPCFVIADSPGFVAQRVVACIVNLACEIAQQGISSPNEIDIALRTALGYPMGPFEWGDQIGAKNVLKILEGLHTSFGDQRYRPSPWLIRRARLSLSLSCPDRAA